jgi:hypothetical protein
MGKESQVAFALEWEHAGFLGGPVSINVASADANLVPSLGRAFGCRLSPGRDRVTVFLPVTWSPALLRDLGAGGPLAAVFSRPSTHRTLQLKGRDVVVEALAPDDRERMLAYGEQFGNEIRGLGYSEPFTKGLVAAVRDEAVAVTFTPFAVYAQTPGPGAGQQLEGSK